MSRQPLLIALEGLDGAGKSTCANHLALRLDAELWTTPSKQVREFHERLVGSFNGGQEAAQLFYMATVFDASARIRQLLNEGKSVILDRYFLSTQAYAEFRGSSLELDAFEKYLLPANYTIYLDVPLPIRELRLERRGFTSADRETLHPQADKELRDLYLKRSNLAVVGQFHRVHVENESVEEVVARILQQLQ